MYMYYTFLIILKRFRWKWSDLFIDKRRWAGNKTGSWIIEFQASWIDGSNINHLMQFHGNTWNSIEESFLQLISNIIYNLQI